MGWEREVPATIGFFATSARAAPTSAVACIKTDSVYRAIALGIIDCLSSAQISLRHPGLSLLVKRYLQSFTPHSSVQKYHTPFQQLRQLIQEAQDSNALTNFIDQLSRVVFQLTLYALQQHPTLYHEYALPVKERDYFTAWIDKSAPAAIANLLGWQIEIKIVAAGKPLHAKFIYSPHCQTTQTAITPLLKIQERHDVYSTFVRTPELQLCQLPPETVPYGTIEDIEKLLPNLRQEKQAFHEKYQTIYRRLDTQVRAQELTKDQLSSVYQESLIRQRLHGIQAFSDSIQLTDVHNGHLIPELLSSLTCLIILGYVSEEAFFEKTCTPSIAMPSV